MNYMTKINIEEDKYVIKSSLSLFNRFKTVYKYFLHEYIPFYSIMYGFIPGFIFSIMAGSEQVSLLIKFVIGLVTFISILTYSTAFFNTILSFRYLSERATQKIARKNFRNELVSETTLKNFKSEFSEKEINNYFSEDLDKNKTTNADIKRYISAKDNMRIISDNELRLFINKYSKYEVERMKRENPHHFITYYDLKVMEKNSKKYVFDNPMYNV